ncbi:MAG: transporter substrate-binding domain-containing protein [Paludibacterium sp.]|uniref:substrate-binding periplasmic protein n=1 Tax=Paludibacterium sp. TaxID=1917523 RepID=UPI0025F6EEB5|nr:transporter substrate-binding domain-containing protein [Paludibacterium sp.]MBV8047808.1 transporter substrate-binding domain-containing protein [Paludibacterium sp.]MBV8646664.1 transporter substrate-binding domain-containing protein [Paludibacterium sp.]
MPGAVLHRVVLLLLIVLSPAQAFAAAPVARPTLVLAFSPLPPWRVIDAHGQPSGPYLDIVRRLAQHAGMNLVVHTCPLLRCLDMLQHGDADVGIGVAPGPDRSAIVDFVVPPFAEGSTVCFYRRRGDTRARVAQYGDLRGLRIGVTDGAHYFPRFDQDARLIKDSAPDKISNLRKLLARRVDVATMVCGEASLLLSRHEFSGQLELAGPPVKTGPRYVVLAWHSPQYEKKDRLQRALRQMIASGEIRRLLAPVEQNTQR